MFNDYEVSYQEIMRLEEEITRWRERFFNTDAIAAKRSEEIDRLKEEVKELKELVQLILAEAYRNGVEIIVHEKREAQGE